MTKTLTAIAVAAMLTVTPLHSIAQPQPVAEITLMWDQPTTAQADVVILQRKVGDGQYTDLVRLPFAPGSNHQHKHSAPDLGKVHCFTAYNMKVISGTEVWSKGSNEVCMTPAYVEGVINFRGVLNLR